MRIVPLNIIKEFIKYESSSSILLLVATFIALIIANSPLKSFYFDFLNYSIILKFGSIIHLITLQQFINEGLMTLFFLLISLEVKRELLIGELSTVKKAALPIFSALGGMLMPALIYLFFNFHRPETIQGWAIPIATDVAFSLNILALFRIPLPLKTFLISLAIIDDVGAITTIALFYSVQTPNFVFLFFAGVFFLILIIFNYVGVREIFPYIIIGFFLWCCVVEANIHATIVGVLIGFAIPLKNKKHKTTSPLIKLEHNLEPWIAFGILPLFAFANAGVSFLGVNASALLDPLVLGIVLGLFIGKQLGIFLPCWIAVKAKFAELPRGTTWVRFYGMSVLCGIGFTMSLLIGDLAFSTSNPEYFDLVKISVLIGSLISSIVGSLILWITGRKRKHHI